MNSKQYEKDPNSAMTHLSGIAAHWQFEVIGTIHDNQEMMKGGAE